MGFPLKGRWWHLSSATGGIAGEKNLQNVPLHGTNPYPSKFGKFGKLIDSKVPA